MTDAGVRLLTLGSNGGSADSAAYVSQEAVQQLAAAAVLQNQLWQGVVILQLLQNLHAPVFLVCFLCFWVFPGKEGRVIKENDDPGEIGRSERGTS